MERAEEMCLRTEQPCSRLDLHEQGTRTAETGGKGMKQIFDSDWEYAKKAANSLLALSEDVAKYGDLTSAVIIRKYAMDIRSVLDGAM